MKYILTVLMAIALLSACRDNRQQAAEQIQKIHICCLSFENCKLFDVRIYRENLYPGVGFIGNSELVLNTADILFLAWKPDIRLLSVPCYYEFDHSVTSRS